MSLIKSAVLAGVILAAPAIVWAACDNKPTVVVKANQYGAINQDKYSIMDSALRNHDQQKIDEMIKNFEIIKISDGQLACLVQSNLSWYRAKLLIPETTRSYWVSDSSYTVMK